MSRWQRVYSYALFGALGGLIGWLLFGELVGPNLEWWLQAVCGGVLIGALIGYFIASVDAVMDRAWVRFCRFAFIGILFGAGGGALGFLLGDWVNYLLVATAGAEASIFAKFLGILARGLGWMLFGMAVGMSEGVAARSAGKMSYGLLGGSLGGFVGGVVFGTLMLLLDEETGGYVWGQAIGLVILGACIGALTALVEEVLKPAAVKVVRGWQEGREYPLVKLSSVIGRDEAADILLLRDMKVEKQHAIIHRRGDRYLLMNNQAPAQNTLVNETPVGESCELHDGDRLQIGNVVLRFIVRGPARDRGPMTRE